MEKTDIAKTLQTLQEQMNALNETFSNLAAAFNVQAENLPETPKKYDLTNESIEVRGTTLYRIVALRDIPELNVRKGDKGGYVQSEDNLSQDGSAWVSDNARVFDNAQVFGNTVVNGHTQVFDYC